MTRINSALLALAGNLSCKSCEFFYSCKKRRIFDYFHLIRKPCTNYSEDKLCSGWAKYSNEIEEKRIRKMNKEKLREIKKQQKAYEAFKEGF